MAAVIPEAGPVAYTPPDDRSPARKQVDARLMSIQGVVGVGEGNLGEKAVWFAYITAPHTSALLPRELEGRQVVPYVTGAIKAL